MHYGTTRRSTSLRSLKSTLSRSFAARLNSATVSGNYCGQKHATSLQLLEHPFANAFQLVARAQISYDDLLNATPPHSLHSIFIPDKGMFELKLIIVRLNTSDSINCPPFDTHLTAMCSVQPLSCIRPIFEGVLTVTVRYMQNNSNEMPIACSHAREALYYLTGFSVKSHGRRYSVAHLRSRR